MKKPWEEAGIVFAGSSVAVIGIFIAAITGFIAHDESNYIPPETIDQQSEVVPSVTTEEIIELDGPLVGTQSRSPKWDRVRDRFAAAHPACEVCGSVKDINIHHIKPFHLYPELELDETNLITLCRYHHFHVGHLGDWRKENTHLMDDISKMKTKKAPSQP